MTNRNFIGREFGIRLLQEIDLATMTQIISVLDSDCRNTIVQHLLRMHEVGRFIDRNVLVVFGFLLIAAFADVGQCFVDMAFFFGDHMYIAGCQ